jgi:hypothetical protein
MIIKQLHVDLWQKILQPITVVQHEAEGRRLAITLTGGGLPVNLTGCDVIFYAQKPDENILFNNCVIVDEAAGQVEYTITEQTVVLAGTLKCWIVVIKDGATIRSQEFHITVQESPDFTEAVESTSEFSDLEEALALVSGHEARITAAEGDIDTAESDIVNLKTGWIPAGETWTRTSANTLTVAGDVTGKYRIGDKIKCYSGDHKAFYIINVAYAEGTTTVTVSPGVILSTLAPTTLTGVIVASTNYYSKIENPQGFPGWFSYNPSYGAAGSMTYTSVETTYAKFRISGECVFLKVRASGTTGGSASAYITVSLPFAAYAAIGGGGSAFVFDGSTIGGYAYMDGSNSVYRVYKYDSSSWGIGASKMIWLDAFFFIK